jgi:hypothetical protein
MSNTPGTFYLRLFDGVGVRVDQDNAVVTSNDTEIMVGVRPNLPAGTYTAQWFTTGVDGHTDSGSLTISLAGAAATPGQMAPPQTAPASGAARHDHEHDHEMTPNQAPAALAAGHTHEEGEEHEHDEAGPATLAIAQLPVSFSVSLLGSSEVPPVSTSARGTARLVFFPATSILEIHVTMLGVSASQLTGVHLHRGAPNANGPHVFDLINASFTSVGGSSTLSDSAVRDLLAGNLYINVHSIDFPPGLVRGQVVLPLSSIQHATSHDHEDTDDHEDDHDEDDHDDNHDHDEDDHDH